MLNKIKKVILYILGEWTINALIFSVLLVLCKVISPVFLLGPLPVVMIYWIVTAAAKSGKVSIWSGKQISIHEKYKFSLALTVWISMAVSGPVVIIASLLKWQYNGVFWAFFVMLQFIIYFLTVLFNPYLKKISVKNHS